MKYLSKALQELQEKRKVEQQKLENKKQLNKLKRAVEQSNQSIQWSYKAITNYQQSIEAQQEYLVTTDNNITELKKRTIGV